MREVDTLQNIATDIYFANDMKFPMAKVMRFAKKSVESLSLTINTSVKTDVATILDNGTALLPKDCAEVYKVGAIGCGGKCIIAMGRVDKIYKNLDTQNKIQCGNCNCNMSDDTAPQADDTNYGSTICDNLVFHGFGGNLRGELYAYRKPLFPNGQYEYDEVNNRLVFSDGTATKTGDQVAIEYRPLLSSENYQLIPKIAFDVILHKTNTYLMSGNEKMAEEKLYRDYHFKFKRDTYKFNLDWISEILRG